ncbi:MAG: hypothetical protein ABWY25_09690 [Paenisporosarcina sp.]
MENENVTIWNKKPDDLTVGESMKIGAVYTAVAVAAPFAVLMVAGGMSHLYNKFQERRANKKEVKKTQK